MSAHARPLAVILAAALGGCASQSHRIPREDLMVLAQTDPSARGAKVRVIQGLGNELDPPPAPRASGGVDVVVVAPIWVDGTPHHHGHVHGGGGGGGGPTSPGGGSQLAKAKKEDAKALLVVAAVVAGALALTEGLRYDGWVRLHPMHPVHLYGPYGEYTWMPLAQVTPDVAAWADVAIVREGEGPWEPLGRAPLDRVGFTYSLLLGGGQFALLGTDPEAGFQSHLQVGFFPLQVFGVQLDLAYGWAEDDFGNQLFDGRGGVELDLLPLRAGRLHGGVFGVLGVSSRFDDGLQFDDQDGYLGGGGILQLELTTRLALTARGGLTAVHDEHLSELTVGVSIY
jgi:hypothetical protein